jgi:hypothetical protein
MNPVMSLNLPQVPTGAVASGSASHDVWGRIGRRVWAALEGAGQTRARPELLALASRYEASQPELAAQLRSMASVRQR